MRIGTLTLDTILSAMKLHVWTWSPELVWIQNRDLLRFFLIRFYGGNHGNLITASLTISQSLLADKLGVTRECCNKLLAQPRDAEGRHYSSRRREGGLRATRTFAVGNTPRCLLLALTKSHAQKNQQPRCEVPFTVFSFFSLRNY